MYSSDAAMTMTHYVLPPIWTKTPAGLRTARDAVCVFMKRRQKCSVAAETQVEDVSLIAMITREARGVLRFGVSLCILGMRMDEMNLPNTHRTAAAWKTAPSADQCYIHLTIYNDKEDI